MSKAYLLVLAVLMSISLLLGGCAAPPAENVTAEADAVTSAPVEVATDEPTEEPVEEPTEEPTEEPAAVLTAEEALTTNFSAFFANMTGFNAIMPNAIYQQIVDGNAPFLLDVRSAEEIEETGYIEGAVNIPLRELVQNIDKLPSPDTPIVVYCGVGMRSAIGAIALAALGYTDVKVMQGGGFGGWVEAGLPVVEGLPEDAPVLNAFEPEPAAVEAVTAMLATLPPGWAQVKAEDLNAEIADGAEIVFLDVRSAEEVAENGYIEGSVHIPLNELIERRADWPPPDANIVAYCGVGYRGNLAMSILRAYGYQNVRNLSGGLPSWQEAGFPVVTQ